jgi:hypothetical protein
LSHGIKAGRFHLQVWPFFGEEESMARKSTVIAVVLVVALMGMVGAASAAPNVANTSQKGSLLIWPKIIVLQNPTNGLVVDTVIFIGNDYFEDVWVKCYWVDKGQQIEDFMFRITSNQPVYFHAAPRKLLTLDKQREYDGVSVPPFVIDGNMTGELKCWAVNDNGDKQLSFNHLYGNAWIQSEAAGVVYNAYAFAAKKPFGQTVGTGGTLLLNGTTDYDACPQYLLFNFVPGLEGQNFEPDLTLVPCKQDLRQDRTPTYTKAKFDIWNTDETKFTGAYQCIKCWWEDELDRIGAIGSTATPGYGGHKFTWDTLYSFANRFRVQGVASSYSVCPYGASPSPLLGLMLYVQKDRPNPLPFAGYTAAGAGLDGSGFIYWDPQSEPIPEAPKK